MRAGNLIGTTTLNADSLQPMCPEEFDVREYNQGDEIEFYVSSNYLGGVPMGAVAIQPEQFAEHGFNDYVLLDDTGASIQAYLGVKIKPRGKHYPADPPSTFRVEVEKGETGRYGMEIDFSDGKNLVVHGVVAGAFAEYNKSAEPSKQLRKSDFIVSVNEKLGGRLPQTVSGIKDKMRRNAGL
jgi:hypothetical protein